MNFDCRIPGKFKKIKTDEGIPRRDRDITASQLTRVIEKTLTGTVAGVHAFGYDAAGNMTTMQKSGGTPNVVNVTTRAHNPLNQVTALRMTGAPAQRGAHAPSRVVSGALAGNFAGNRLCAGMGCEASVQRAAEPRGRASGHAMARMLPHPKLKRRYYPQGEQTIYQDPPTGNLSVTATHHYTRDHLGSIREVVKTDGTLQARYDYDPYGKRIPQYESTAYGTCPFGFTGTTRRKALSQGRGNSY